MTRSAISRRVIGLVVVAGAGISVGTLSACSSGTAQGAGAVPAAASISLPSTSTSPSSPAAPSASGPLTPDQASAIAVQTSPGTVTEVEPDVEPTGPVFDVKVLHADGSETKVEVDANTGQVISTETDGADDPNEPNDQPDDGQ